MTTTETVTRKRPTTSDPEVIALAAEGVLAEVVEWCEGQDDDVDESGREEILKILKGSMRYHINGYDLAREFERAGFEPDARLVEILDNADPYRAHSKAVKAWIEETGARPALALGAVVQTPPRRHTNRATGEIVRIDMQQGTYTIMCESLGHVREGLGTHGSIFEWEEVEAANLEASA